MCNIMVDLETLGTRPGCVVLTVAAVPFANPYPLDDFYVRISQKSSMEFGLYVEDQAARWWDEQPAPARDEAYGGTTELQSALYAFKDYCAALPSAPILWGNSAAFDCGILEAAYIAVGIEKPWSFRNERCYRTLKNVMKQIPAKKSKVYHHALHDAKAQAEHAEQILNWIKGR